MSDSICLQLQLGVVARQTLKNLLEEYRTLPTTLLSDTATADAHQLTVTLRCCDGFSREAQAVVATNSNRWEPYFLSPLERQILRCVIEKGAAPAKWIAQRTQHTDAAGSPNVKVRGVLANLVEREILAVTDEGYALTPVFTAFARVILPDLFAASH